MNRVQDEPARNHDHAIELSADIVHRKMNSKEQYTRCEAPKLGALPARATQARFQFAARAGAPPPVVPAPAAVFVQRGMRFMRITRRHALQRQSDPEFALQVLPSKYQRLLVRRENGGRAIVTDEFGTEADVPHATRSRLQMLPGTMFLDGMLQGSIFTIYDMLTGEIGTDFRTRQAALRDLDLSDTDGFVQITPVGFTVVEKGKLAQAALQQRTQGLLYRHVEGTYTPGVEARDGVCNLWYESVLKVTGAADGCLITEGKYYPERDNGSSRYPLAPIQVDPAMLATAITASMEDRPLYAHVQYHYCQAGALVLPAVLGLYDVFADAFALCEDELIYGEDGVQYAP